MPAERGFTLLEIIVALAIAAVGIAAVAKTTGGAAAVMQATEERMVAYWVADNRLAELRLSRAWPRASESDRTALMGGRTWHYREAIATTADPDLLRVDIEVYSDGEHEKLGASLFGYLARVSAPEESDDDHAR